MNTTQVINKNKPVKQVDRAFGKDVYLLGKDKGGMKYWLEVPSWDCGWYWGFGYVENYQQNWAPSKARDIDCHRHIDTLFIKDGKIQMWQSALAWHTYTKEEAIELNELFSKFYELRKLADMIHENKFNTDYIESLSTATAISDKHAKWIDLVSREIPAVTKRIIEILTPSK